MKFVVISPRAISLYFSFAKVLASITDYLKTNVGIGWVNFYGGEKRFPEAVVEGFGK